MFIDTLTEREEEVLDLFLEGLSNKEIASQLNIAEHTIKIHLGRIYKKFGVTGSRQLYAKAIEQKGT